MESLNLLYSKENTSVPRRQFLKLRMHHLKESIGVFKIGGLNKTSQNRNHDILVDGLNSVKNCL